MIPTTTCIARILDESIELSGYHLTTGVSNSYGVIHKLSVFCFLIQIVV